MQTWEGIKTVESEVQDDQKVIDQALNEVFSHYYKIAGQLHESAGRQIFAEELRAGPLGQDLTRLALIARGRVREEREHVLDAVENALNVLFWPAGADEYVVPRAFWDSDLGRILAQAKYRAYEPNELMSIGNAAQALGVTRPTIYRWMDERQLDYVRDEMSGRTFVVRRDIDLRRQVHEPGMVEASAD